MHLSFKRYKGVVYFATAIFRYKTVSPVLTADALHTRALIRCLIAVIVIPLSSTALLRIF